MQVYGQHDVARLRAFGIKKALARLLAARPVNPLARRLARRWSPAKRLSLPLSQSSITYRQTTEPVLLLEPRIDQVARDLYWGGGKPQSPADARVLRCVESLCRGGGTFLDIGSYSGLFAMAAARSHPELRAFAFEIVPENYLLICRNIIANDLAGQVQARLVGLADAAGSIKMPAQLHLASLASSMSIGSAFTSGIDIPLSTLDEECSRCEGPLAMKIDVEGFEGAVFRGGRATIERLRPEIVCELLPGAPDCRVIEALLAPLGYRFFQSREHGFHAADRLTADERGRDWLFSCRHDIDALIARL